jgi:DNA-binding response OmpR family regulator
MNANRFEGLRILLVDDDPDILESMALAIKNEGADVATAADGNTAVSLFNAHEPDAVVLDMMLPKRSGFLVLEKIQEVDTPPPVVMITANQGRRHMEYARNLGVSAYMVKPVALSMLMDKISEVLDASEA